MVAVAIYTRISSDPSGEQTSTGRQEEACRGYALARGWEVAAVYEDVDVSAYKPGVVRPAFERLQISLAALDGVICWRLDRLSRRPADFERLWEQCEHHGVFIASATEPVDTSTELGVAVVRILITFAQLESHAKSERVSARLAEMAREGKLGKRTAFGFTPGFTDVVPHEAALVREAATRFTQGETLAAIAQSWNDRGDRNRSGCMWTSSSLRAMLLSPRMVGDHVHAGVVVARDRFPRVLERDLADEVLAIITRNTRVVSHPRRRALSGLLICGRCGGRLSSGRHYTCPKPPGGCQNMSLAADPTDAWMAHNIVWRQSVGGTPTTLQDWSLLSIAQRRELVLRHVHEIVVRPPPRATTRWSPERLDVSWIHRAPDAPPFRWPYMSELRQALIDPDRISVSDASEILGVTLSSLYHQIAAGRIEAQRHGRSWTLSRAEVELRARSLASNAKRLAGHEQEIADAYRSGMSIGKLRAKYGVSDSPIKRVLREEYVQLRRVGRQSLAWAHEQEIVDAYLAGSTVQVIAFEHEVTAGTIVNLLRTAGVRNRTRRG